MWEERNERRDQSEGGMRLDVKRLGREGLSWNKSMTLYQAEYLVPSCCHLVPK